MSVIHFVQIYSDALQSESVLSISYPEKPLSACSDSLPKCLIHKDKYLVVEEIKLERAVKLPIARYHISWKKEFRNSCRKQTKFSP